MLRNSFPIAIVLLMSFANASISRADEKKEQPNGKEAPRTNVAKLNVVVPAYFYPAGPGLTAWERMIQASERIPIIAIVDPDNGPGKQVDPNYISILQKARRGKHLRLVGYVSTSYAKRTITEVKQDIDQWIKMYSPLDGIFLDEQNSGVDQVRYYDDVYRYITNEKKLKVVLTNPGTICAEEYFSKGATDIACLYEGTKPFTDAPFPPWMTQYPKRDTLALSYDVTNVDTMRKCVAFAVEKRIHYLYVTDAKGANPWDRLPTYWDEEVIAIDQGNHDRTR